MVRMSAMYNTRAPTIAIKQTEGVVVMKFEDLSPELQEKAKACKNAEELFNLAKAEGIELGEEELEAINGGMVSGWSIPGCPKFDGHTKRVK